MSEPISRPMDDVGERRDDFFPATPTRQPEGVADARPSGPIEIHGSAGAAPVATAPVAGRRALRRPRVGFRRRLGDAFAGLNAVGVKELRGRMRGRRAFVILTVYLVLLGAFTWMMQLILEQRYRGTSAGSAAFASAEIGQGVFAALMMLETLLVLALAPAFTAGAISLEREKQTLDMLATTPISSLSIVIAKLFSALTYLFILIFASIPLTALVFVFGGVSPDDVVRGYVVLLATAVGLGAVGLFFSALMKRTQGATIATYFGVLFVTLGAFFVFFFWTSMAESNGGRGIGPIKGRPPEPLVWLNPYFAQADVLCGAEDGFGQWCSQVAMVAERPIFGTGRTLPPVVPTEPTQDTGIDVMPEVQPFGVVRDSFWPRSAAAWLILAAVLIVASVQLVTPTRRWRPRLPASLRGSARRSYP